MSTENVNLVPEGFNMFFLCTSGVGNLDLHFVLCLGSSLFN